MFESAEVGREVDKKEYEKSVDVLRARILHAQLALAETGLNLVVVVGGVEGAGKTDVARRLLGWMDARGLAVESYAERSDEEEERPEYWRYWRTLPGAGHGAILVGSWYTKPIVCRVFKKIGEGDFDRALDRAIGFETMLVRENTVFVKLWLHLSKKAQKRRFKDLESHPDTAWRVTKQDWIFAKKYDRFREVCERALAKTSTAEAPWAVVEAADWRWRNLASGGAVADALERALKEAHKRAPKPQPGLSKPPKVSVLSRLDLSKRLKGGYDEKLDKQQTRVALLSRKLRKEGRSLICAFEGVDAAGKGGAIRRLLSALDVRNARVMTVAAPTDEERAHPYLWRFWRQLPRVGKTTIYDRSWYGRVLVERVEGFAAPEDWRRAYAEISSFEEELTEAGVIVCKFWLQISQEEQLKRFKARGKTPYKQYKITEEDWRNREKWDAYQAAAIEMIEKTSTPDAPWTLLEGEDKRWARLRVMKAVADRLEEELG